MPGFSQIAAPLHCLLKKGAQFYWSVECQDAFQKLKKLLTSAPVLSYPQFDPNLPLKTDASAKGLGAILAQQ